MILKYIVNNNCNYTTVRNILKNEFNMSNRLITKLKLNNCILLNNEKTFLDKKVFINNVLTCNLDLEEDSSNIVPKQMELDIIYEDEWLLIINKPAGIAIHPSCLHYDNSLSNGIKYYFDKIELHKKIRPVTRIDKDTSGIVVFAKNEYIQECLIKQMQSKTFVKKYIAILNGNLDSKIGVIDTPISRKNGSIIERCVNPKGETAITHYKLIKNLENICIVEFTLETGRTHQIRVHSKYIGHPILGDTLYGETSKLICRQALHCFNIKFVHPISKSNLEFTISLPNDMKFCEV